MSSEAYYALSYGGFSQYEKFCVLQSIPFKTYERYDEGGGCGDILHIMKDSHVKAIQKYFNLDKNSFGNIKE